MTRLFRILPLVLLAALALTACGRRARATQTATVATSGGGTTVAAPSSVSHRHYRNLVRVAARDMQCHQRDVAPQEVSPGIFAVSGCGQLRDYALVCRSARRCAWMGIQPVEQVAMAETQCTVGQIVVQPTGPLSRSVSACGQSLEYALACGPGSCAWTRGAISGGVVMQTEPGTSVIVVPDAPAASGTVVVQEAGSGAGADIVQIDAAGTLQALLATQIAAVRQCTGGQTVTLQIRWSAQGQVGVALAPPHTSTPIEACVQQAVGTVVLQGVSAPGQIQATL